MKPRIFVTTFRDYHDETVHFYSECKRDTKVELDDILIVALGDQNPVGIVRLCCEEQTYVLRTMQVHPSVQREGIGKLLLEKFDLILNQKNIDTVYCMPYAHLEIFYGRIGFSKILVAEAPQFLQERIESLVRRKPDEKVILMRKSISIETVPQFKIE